MTFTLRREVVLGGALTLAFGGRCSCVLAQVSPYPTFGCVVPPTRESEFHGRATRAETFETGTEQLEPRSNNAPLDYALAQTLARLARTFDVLPAFSYFREERDDDYNALATKSPMLKRTDGTVLFGLGMLRHLLDVSERADAAIISVCAHEFGHIASMKRNEIDMLAPDPAQPYRAEQHADYVSGFYAGLRAREVKDYPALIFATTARALGRPTRGTHGTSAERGRAVVEGFKAAKDRNLSVGEGLDEALRYAMSQT